MTTIRPTGPMDCITAQALLPDYLEGELAGTAHQTFESHLAACEVCDGLVTELRGIVRMAAALPPRQPSRDLWSGIAERIEAPVVPLVTGEHALPQRPRRVPAATQADGGERRGRAIPVRQRWLAAAAALLLVAGTAGVTRLLTLENGSAPVAASSAPAAGVAAADVAASSVGGATAGAPELAGGNMDGPAAAGGSASARPEPANAVGAQRPIAGETRLASGPSRTPAAAGAPPSLYDRELGELRGLLDAQRATLDSVTIRVLEQNIRIIDGAIRESREALMSDPASGLLNQRLNESLSEKLDLMRTAVLLSGD